MKNIYDFYENVEINSTPANTSGMGNPMPATEQQPGSEPLSPRKKKKSCCKKEEKVSEGILSDIDSNLQINDDIIEFAKWFINQWNIGQNRNFDVDAALTALASAVSIKNKNTAIIDVEAAYKPNIKHFMADRMYIKTLPKNITTIKFINAKYGVDVCSYVGDLSNLNIEIYRDNEKSYSDIAISFRSDTTGNVIKLGRIICDLFRLSHVKMETLMFSNDSIMLEIILDSCECLQQIYGKFSHAEEAKLPKKYIVHQLCQSGVLPWGIKLNIYGY